VLAAAARANCAPRRRPELFQAGPIPPRPRAIDRSHAEFEEHVPFENDIEPWEFDTDDRGIPF
jgi:hypothetical protein